MDDDQEFRIFVYKNRITAISQQNLYSVNEWLASKDDGEIKVIVEHIISGFDKEIAPKMNWLGSYVMDLVLIGSGLYFIEPNTWGGDYSSGSSLFHWERDRDLLYQDPPTKIEIRFVNK